MDAEQSALMRLRRGAVEAFLLRVLGAGLLFSMHAVIARVLGKEGFGIFSYAVSLAGLLAFIVPLGWTTALLRFVSEYRERKRWGLLKGSILTAHGVSFVSCSLAALALWGVAFAAPMSPDMARSLRYASVLLPLLTFANLRRGALRGLQCVKASVVPDEIVLPVLAVAGVYAFAAADASDALRIYAAVALIVFLAGAVLLCRSLPEQGRTAAAEFRTRKWMAIALPMLFGEASKIIIVRTDVLMLGAMVNMDAVGLYSAAVRIASLNLFLLWAINTIAAPMLASAHHGDRPGEFRAIMRKAVIWSAVGTLPLFIIMVIGAQHLLAVFGPKFAEGAVLLRVLALGQFVNAAAGPVGLALLMSGGERRFAFSTGVVAGGNAVGNFFAIKAFGAAGAACVTAASVILLNGWQYKLTRAIYRNQGKSS
jgi:O-antigen/teichoic acid export membrane protein